MPYTFLQFSYDDVIKWKHIFALLALSEGNPPATGGFPPQRPVTRSFDVFLDMRLNKRLSKQSKRCWFETLSCSLWRHCNEVRAPVQHLHMSDLYSELTTWQVSRSVSPAMAARWHFPGIILSTPPPANSRRRYNVTSPLIAWAYTQNDPWCPILIWVPS